MPIERKDTLIFSGQGIPEVTAGENCTAIVKDIVKNKLQLEIRVNDISTAHRLGKKVSNQQPDKRNIIIKLCRRDQKSDILNACRQLKPDIYINESLTPIRGTIMYVLRKARRQFPRIITGCYSRDGRVFVWLRSPNSSPNDKDIRQSVNSRLKLEELCRSTLKTPLTTFIQNWPH